MANSVHDRRRNLPAAVRVMKVQYAYAIYDEDALHMVTAMARGDA
jgi:hypothetical protein